MRHAHAVLVVFLVAGCGRLGFTPPEGDSATLEDANDDAGDAARPDTMLFGDSGPVDGSPTDSGSGDTSTPFDSGSTDGGSPDAGTVVLTGAFGPPTLIAAASDPAAGDDDPSLTADLRELYFNSDRTGNGEIFRSTRMLATDAWGPPSRVSELSGPTDDSTPQVSADGLTIWISSDRAGGMGGRDLWVATRATRGDIWSAPVHVPELSSTVNETGGSPTASLLLMTLNSNRTGGAGGFDLFITDRPGSSATWSMPVPIVEINTTSNETGSSLGANGLLITFSSNRPGGAGSGDIYSASRSSTSDAFGTITRHVELASSGSDSDTWISPDGRHIFFSSDRMGTEDLFFATR